MSRSFFSIKDLILKPPSFFLRSNAVLSFAVESLKVKHVVVMGHYGCGGVAASMVPPPGLGSLPAVQNWILPIRQIYETSKRFDESFF